MLLVLSLLMLPIGAEKGRADTVSDSLTSDVRRLSIYLKQSSYVLPSAVNQALQSAVRQKNSAQAEKAVHKALEPLSLIHIHINPEARVKAAPGRVVPQLGQNRWRLFLVKVHNEAGVTAELRVSSLNLVSLSRRHAPPHHATQRQRWMQLKLSGMPKGKGARPSLLHLPKPRLSGARVQYMMLFVNSRETGKREATLSFDIGQGTQDLGFRSEVSLLFNILPTIPSPKPAHPKSAK
jgi:hypothetical protein